MPRDRVAIKNDVRPSPAKQSVTECLFEVGRSRPKHGRRCARLSRHVSRHVKTGQVRSRDASKAKTLLELGSKERSGSHTVATPACLDSE